MTTFPLIEVEGPPLERGRQYGQQASSSIKKSIELYTTVLSKGDIGWDGIRTEARRFIPTIESYNPDYMKEMQGIAQGAGVDLEAVLLVNARSEILYGRQKPAASETDHHDGCTTVVALSEATQNGHVLQGQNWDWKAACLDTTIILHIHQDDAPDIITLVEAGGLARHGINSRGIAVGANFLHTEQDFGSSGIPLGLIRRKILDSNLYYDALAAVLQPPRAFSNNIMVTTADGESVCLETTPNEVFWVWPESGLLVHSNHFLCPVARSKYKDIKVPASPDTLYRKRRVDSILSPRLGKVTMEDIITALFDDFGYPRSVCRPPVKDSFQNGESMTVAMIVMDVTDRTMFVCAEPHTNKKFTKYKLD